MKEEIGRSGYASNQEEKRETPVFAMDSIPLFQSFASGCPPQHIDSAKNVIHFRHVKPRPEEDMGQLSYQDPQEVSTTLLVVDDRIEPYQLASAEERVLVIDNVTSGSDRFQALSRMMVSG